MDWRMVDVSGLSLTKSIHFKRQLIITGHMLHTRTWYGVRCRLSMCQGVMEGVKVTWFFSY